MKMKKVSIKEIWFEVVDDGEEDKVTAVYLKTETGKVFTTVDVSFIPLNEEKDEK